MESKVINGKEYLFVEVPRELDLFCEVIPNAIGKASFLTEDQWKEIVEPYGEWAFVNYNKILRSMACSTAINSGLSLISSLGLKPETTLIIHKTTL